MGIYYEKSITLKKGLINFALAMLSGGMVYLMQLPSEQQMVWWGMAMGLMKMAENYLKHHED